MDRLSEVLGEYERLGIRQQINYEKFYLYSIITHSTAIEGSTVTEIENQLLFDEGIAAAKPMPETRLRKRIFFSGKTRRDHTADPL